MRNGEFEVPIEKMAEIQKAWLKILDGCPVAYLTGEKEFYGIPLFVNENVLVPRPETELLVDHVKEIASEGARVLEIGTGSGALSIALKKTCPDFQVLATDVSSEALKVARQNIDKYDLDIKLIESDLLESVEVILTFWWQICLISVNLQMIFLLKMLENMNRLWRFLEVMMACVYMKKCFSRRGEDLNISWERLIFARQASRRSVLICLS